MTETQLIVNDRYVQLKAGTVITYTKRKIDIGKLESRYSDITNEFDAVDSDYNRVTFGFAGELQSSTNKPYRLLSAKLVQDSIETLGVVRVKKFDKGYKIHFIEDGFDFFSAIKGLPLSTVSPITDSVWTEYDMDEARDSIDGLISAIVYWGTGVNTFESNRYLPSFYYHTLVKKVFEYFGLTVSGDILTDARFTDLVIPFPFGSFTKLNAVDAPSYIGRGSAGITAGTSTSFTYPNDLQENDLLLLHVISVGLGTITVDGSWTSLGSLIYSTTFVSQLYWKKAAGTETTENVTRSGAGAGNLIVQVYQFRGDQYGPDANITIDDSDSSSGNGTTITWAATDVTHSKQTLAALVVNYNGADPGSPSGYTNESTENDGSNTYFELNVKEDVSSDGSVTGTNGSSNGWVTWHVSIENARQNVDWNSYLSEIKCDDLIKDFFNRFGIVQKFSGSTLYLKTLEAIITDTINVMDWSDKLTDNDEPIDFALSGYGQNTLFNYTDSDLVNDETLGRGTMVIDDETLPGEVERYKTFFENCLTENTTGTLLAHIPIYNTESENSGDIQEDPGIKLLTLKARTSEAAITFDQTARTDYKIGYFVDGALSKDTGWQYFLDEFYPSFTAALQRYKLVTKEYYLTALDIYNYDPHKMVYDGTGYYLVNKIRNFIPGKITKVELIKIL